MCGDRELEVRLTSGFPKDLHIGMNFNKLQNTDLVVSELCLGTMTFGEQVDEDDVEEIMNLACNTYGINFIVSKCCLFKHALAITGSHCSTQP